MTLEDALIDARHQRREAIVRRVCAVMGWDYHQSPIWAGLRKVALAEAVPVALEKLEEMVDAIKEGRQKASDAKILLESWMVTLGVLSTRLEDTVAELIKISGKPSKIAEWLVDLENLIDDIRSLASEEHEGGPS